MVQPEGQYSEVKIGCILFSVCLVVFYASFKYGFVSDDYYRIIIQTWDDLFRFWKDVNFRRPIDEFFYFSFYNLFGYNPLPYRIFLFIIYFINSYLVYRLIYSLTHNQFIGCTMAILFAANTVQFRNIYWISCNILLFTTTFYLIADLLFLRYLYNKTRKTLLISFIVALIGLIMAKEDLLTFPLSVLIISMLLILFQKNSLDRRDILPVIRPTVIFWSIPVIFIGFRIVVSWILSGDVISLYNPMSGIKAEPEGLYSVKFMGIHVLKNLTTQFFWNLGNFGIYWIYTPFLKYASILELRNIGVFGYLMVLGFLACIALIYYRVRSSLSWWYLIAGITWFAGTLAPSLVIVNHIFPYYSAFPAIGLFLSILIPLRAINNPRRVKILRIGMIIFLFLFVINSLYWMHTNEKVNTITANSVFLQRLEKGLKKMYNIFPHDTNLIFLNTKSWFVGNSKAPKIMYNDLSLNVFAQEDFILKGDYFYSKNNINLEKGNTHVFIITPKGVQEVTTTFFKRFQGPIALFEN